MGLHIDDEIYLLQHNYLVCPPEPRQPRYAGD
jgi:hypothetical protein